ncbi:hypothetical protein KC678_03385 [Candidatus Dojkabacteria bacterium]|uniref:Mur ligase central domain-containing protein n=1 Tax=Candidatus Dojkabacteria bacterium TaxID=2099670 RepID=A0A955RGB0_9BACT|nr:hypothetical protein [Candidatus Dojkabacteria bacterium]
MLSILNSYKKNSDLQIIGVAGEHGKTTTSELLWYIFQQNGLHASKLNSTGKFITELDEKVTSDNCSKKDITKFISESQKSNCDIAIIELDSKKLNKSLFSNIAFNSVGISSVGDLENPAPYRKLLESIKEEGLLTVTAEDKDFISWLISQSEEINKTIFCYWVDINNLNEKDFDETGVNLDFYSEGKINSKLKGMYSYENIYLAIRLASNFMPVRNAVEAVSSFEPIPGRFDVAHKDKFSVIVDAAKHPFQLKKSLDYLSKIKDGSKKIISVASVAEDLANAARSIGDLITNYSDILILGPSDSNNMQTFDLNSQLHIGAESKRGRLIDRYFSTEESGAADKYKLANRIFNSMQQGDVPVLAFDAHDYTGRLDAIKMALLLADPGDIVYIMGKGDEKTITFDNTDYEWSDYEALRLALDALN